MNASPLPSVLGMRCIALCTLALALLLSACGDKPASSNPHGSGGPLKRIILQTDWFAQPEHGGFYLALAKGYYREAGLDVTIEQGGPNAIPAQKVALGAAQFAIGPSNELMIASGRGIPLVMVGALMQHDPQGIMFHEESGISSFKDLDGRSIMAVPGAGWITLAERKYGIKISVTPLDFGLSRYLADKFVQQCFITNEPYYVKKQGAKPGVLLLSDTGFQPYRVWYTSRAFIEKDPEAVRAFTAASIRGWREYIDGDRSEADKIIGGLNRQMVPEFIEFSLSTMRKYQLVTGDPAKGEAVGKLDATRLLAELEQMKEIGMLGRVVKLEEVFDPRFLPPELQGGSSP